MSKFVPVAIKGLALDSNDAPVVLLREENGSRVLPIWIGVFEATSIQIALDGVAVERPLTHDIVLALALAANVEITRVAIVGLRDSTYHAEIRLLLPGTDGPESEGSCVHVLDARPSDALAIAARCDSLIVVDEDVLERGHVKTDLDSEESVRKRLEEMGPEELGKYTM